MATNYGRHSSQSHYDYGYIAPGQMRGVTFDRTSKNMWAYQLGILAGKHTAGPDGSPGNVTTRLALYAVDGSMNPTTRLGYSDQMTVSTVMNTWDGGGNQVAAIAVSTGPANTAIPLTANTRYHLAVLGTSGSLGHGMAAAASISGDNRNFYDRSGLSQPPPNPFGSYNQHYEGHVSIWAVCEDNVAPSKPAGLSPSGTIQDTAPAFSAPFVDANSDRGDQLNQFRVQVRRKSDSVSFWNVTLNATNAEKTAKAFSRAYGGSALARGTTYQWRTQVSDYFGTWSEWSNWVDFTPSALGLITLNGAPTSKIEENQPAFQGRWTHQTSTSMKRVQIRLYNGTGSILLQTGADYDIADVASSAAPGTLFTVPWANAGLSALSWGTDYQYSMRGYDGSQWSDWSAKRSFRTNAAPSVPSNLSPNAPPTPLTSMPLLICKATDVDDTVATGLKVYARIKNNSGTVLQTREMTYKSSSDRWEYQTTSTDLASFAKYRWDAYSYDGTLYSGEKTSAGTATTSAEGTFEYAAGPVVTITSPTDGETLTSSSVTVAWTVANGTPFRAVVTIYDDDGEIVSRTTDVTTNPITLPSPGIRTGQSYTLDVEVTTTTSLVGLSAPVAFDVAYPAPDALANVQATAIKIGTDIWESAIRIDWDQTTYPSGDWVDYTIVRQDNPDITVFAGTSPTDTVFIDYFPPSGDDVSYIVTQSILVGLDTLVSVPVVVTARIDLGGVVLCSTRDPEGVRTTLRYTSEREHDRTIDQTAYYPLSGANPTTLRSRQYVREPGFDVQLFDDASASSHDRRRELEIVDRSGDTLCYRDNHGRKMFVTMPECRITDQVPDWYVGTIGLREERYSEEVES